METVVLGILSLIVLAFVRRRDALFVQWNPRTDTWVAIATALLAFAFSTFLLLVPEKSTLRYVVHYGGIYLVCGALIPWAYTLLAENATPAAMGVHGKRVRESLFIGLGLAAAFAVLLGLETDISAIDWSTFTKAAVVLTGAGGLFEVFLYYGFVHLRLERAFGMYPAIGVTSILYVLWHAGTQLPLEPDLVVGIVKLFGVGLFYQSVFALTRNVLIIWPAFHLSGVMLDFTVNINALDRPASELPWALTAIAGMALIVGLLLYIQRRT